MPSTCVVTGGAASAGPRPSLLPPAEGWAARAVGRSKGMTLAAGGRAPSAAAA